MNYALSYLTLCHLSSFTVYSSTFQCCAVCSTVDFARQILFTCTFLFFKIFRTRSVAGIIIITEGIEFANLVRTLR